MSDRTSRSIQAAAPPRSGPARPITSARAERLATAHADPERLLLGYANRHGAIGSAATSFQNVVASTSPDDLTVNFDPVANSLSGSITVRDVTGHDGATEGLCSWIRRLAKSAEPLGLYRRQALRRNRQCRRDFGDPGFRRQRRPGALRAALSSTSPKFFPETCGDGGNKPFCKDCDFLQWGTWGTRINFSNADGPQYTDNIHLGWWVAGDVIDQSDLPTDMTALL
jgi:hypothetical protein